MKEIEFQNTEIAEVFSNYNLPIKKQILELRSLIFDVAKSINEIEKIEEKLKWGQPSYLTNESKSGTTIRIDKNTKNSDEVVLYVNCKTSLVNEWREIYPNLKCGGTRSVHFKLDEELPKEELKHMIAMALTYKTHRKQTSRL